MGAKRLSKFLEGIYWTCPQAVKPSQHYGSQTGCEHFAHQGFVLGIDSHSLIEMAHMLHRVYSPIVDGECWLMEMPSRSYPFNPTRVNGDLAIWFKALLIASFPSPLWMGLLHRHSLWCSSSYENDSLRGVLDLRR